jgi:hypothetical protein
MAQRTVDFKLQANLDGFAAQLMEQLAEQFEVAAESCRERAKAIRDAAGVVDGGAS